MHGTCNAWPATMRQKAQQKLQPGGALRGPVGRRSRIVGSAVRVCLVLACHMLESPWIQFRSLLQSLLHTRRLFVLTDPYGPRHQAEPPEERRAPDVYTYRLLRKYAWRRPNSWGPGVDLHRVAPPKSGVFGPRCGTLGDSIPAWARIPSSVRTRLDKSWATLGGIFGQQLGLESSISGPSFRQIP